MDEESKPATVAITRTSLISGITRTLELPVTREQLDRYEAGDVLLQDAFPDLPRADREFIKTGITAEEWEREFATGEWPAADEPDFDDNALYLMEVTPETLGLVIDLLQENDSSFEPFPDDEEVSLLSGAVDAPDIDIE